MIISATNELGQPTSLFNSTASVFSYTAAIATDPSSGRIAVADANSKRVWVVSPDTTSALPLDYQFSCPHGVAFDARGNLLVSDRHANTITVFDGKGRLTKEITRTTTDIIRPVGIVVDGDTIIVANACDDNIRAFDYDGAHRWSIANEVTSPAALAIDRTHRLLWVSDMNEIRAFALDDGLKPTHTITGNMLTRGLAVDRQGMLHVSDGDGYYIYERVRDDDGGVDYMRILEDLRLPCPPHPLGLAVTEHGVVLLCYGAKIEVIPPFESATREIACAVIPKGIVVD